MLGEKLIELRNKRELTQEQLSKILGMSRSTYAQYEVNRREPDFKTLLRISKYFDVSTDYLLGNTDAPREVLLPQTKGKSPSTAKNKPAPKYIDILESLEDEDTILSAGDQSITKEQRLSILRALISPTKEVAKRFQIPILGTIKAGIPLLSEQNIIGHLDIPADLEGKVDFALYVRGDSMIGAGINNGDIVINKQSEVAQNGQIVVALVNDNETTLKYFFQENERAVLRAANPEYPDIELKPGDKLQGHVVRIQKDPPPINVFRDYIYLKDEYLVDWNEVIEKAISSGIKPSIIKEFVDTQIAIAQKLFNRN